MVDFVFFAKMVNSELGKNLDDEKSGQLTVKNLEKIFANLIQTLTSEARVLNQKACGVQGRKPPLIFFLEI